MDNVKSCFKCRHHRVVKNGDICVRDKSKISIDPVSGSAIYFRSPSCYSERRKAWFFRKDRCGPEGKYFEPMIRPSPPPPPKPLPPPSTMKYEFEID